MYFSRHARLQMAARNITEAEVSEAMKSAHTRYASRDHDDRLVALSDLASGRRLKVITLLSDETYVITVADRDSEV